MARRGSRPHDDAPRDSGKRPQRSVCRLAQARDGRGILGLSSETKGRPRFPMQEIRGHHCKQPVSRILSRTVIPLGDALLRRSSNLPEGFRSTCRASPPVWRTHVSAPGRHAAQLSGSGYASLPIWSCSVWGLPCPRTLPPGRCALTAPFHPYLAPCGVGGMFSVALAVSKP